MSAHVHDVCARSGPIAPLDRACAASAVDPRCPKIQELELGGDRLDEQSHLGAMRVIPEPDTIPGLMDGDLENGFV